MAAALGSASAARAQQAEAFNHAIGTDLFFSTDAEDSSLVKTGLNLDWRSKGPQDYLGLRVENGIAWLVRALESDGRWLPGASPRPSEGYWLSI